MDTRIDYYPTHELNGIKYRCGRVLPFGATMVPNGINFSIFSCAATSCTLVLYKKNAEKPYAEIPFPQDFMIGSVFSMIVFDIDFENLEYGYRMDGPFDPVGGLRFDKTKILSDPYAKAIGGRDVWLAQPDWQKEYQFRSRMAFVDFDWEGDTPVPLPCEDVIIYEMHVRSFTQHPSSGVKYKGTFSGIREKIPYLLELGVNCVELMPIYEFDEFENSRKNDSTGEFLVNYWGYSTVNFFAPKAGFAATGKYGMQVDELKTLVKELHKQGIQVILDVVFNHTAEGDQRGPTISFRGIDNKAYYMLTPDGYYYNFSGTGNTLNCNNPVVRNMVLDCLRYWAAEYHVDGFRFDLATILGRAQDGSPLNNPPLLESLAFDPVLSKCKLIAEAWDAGGLYQVGSFPAYGHWAEWNGKYRDTIRRFLKGEQGMVGDLSQRIQGSPDLYRNRLTTCGVNFITCHDGFTLYDLVAYNGKHNESNGENNRDGNDDNYSWNCGWEGLSTDDGVNKLRHRQIKNAMTMLMVSQGLPMILMGDEMGRTQQGNNNAYCHDTELNWLNWDMKNTNADIFNFVKHLIHFRKAHPVFRSREHFRNTDYMNSGYADISFHGVRAWNADWSNTSTVFAFMLDGDHAKGGTVKDNSIYVVFNMYWNALPFELPQLSRGREWYVSVNTGMEPPYDFYSIDLEEKLQDQRNIIVGGRSVMVLLGK